MKDSQKKEISRSKSKPEVEKKKSSNSLIKWLLIVAAIIVVIAVSFAFSKYLLIPRFTDKKSSVPVKQVEQKKPKKQEMGIIYHLNEFTINLRDVSGNRYLVTELAVECYDEDIIAEIQQREPQIRDEVIRYFRGNTVQKSLEWSFQDDAKIELIRIINSIVSNGKIDSLYFLSLIIQ